MKKIVKKLRVLYLVSALWFGTAAGIDTFQDAYSDVLSTIEQTSHYSEMNDNDNDGLEGTAKGLVALASLFLFLNSQNGDHGEIPLLIEVKIPFDIPNLNLGDAEISHIIDLEEASFMILLKEKIPDYLLEICKIERIEFHVHKGQIEISVHIRILKVPDTEDLVKLILKAIKKYCEDLFNEKFERVQREMVNGIDFEKALKKVLDKQLKEMRNKPLIP